MLESGARYHSAHVLRTPLPQWKGYRQSGVDDAAVSVAPVGSSLRAHYAGLPGSHARVRAVLSSPAPGHKALRYDFECLQGCKEGASPYGAGNRAPLPDYGGKADR